MPLIRDARPEDLAAAGELTLRAYVDGDLLDPGSSYGEALRDAAGRAASADVLVALEDDRVVGTVTFIAEGGPLQEISGPAEAEFRMLAVDAAAAGRGVGAALVTAVADRARERGFTRLVCSSRPRMQAAHRLYARLGFMRAPERDWQPAPGIDLVVFALDL